MTTGSVIVGRAEAGVMACTPEPIAKTIVSRTPADAFESRIACRSDPAPESAVVVTVSVAAGARPEARSPIATKDARCIAPPN